ncbi:MAG: hypothetical protein O7D33_01410 [Chloroflexi bacterium]|nr:hypothetical protein [Chloroflexota bacterium]
MRWHKNRRLGILGLFSIITLFLVAACQGSDGDAGLQGLKGDPGASGAAGSAGDVGTEGQKGDAGSRGGTGSGGSEGPTGDSGEATSAAVVLVSDSVATSNPVFQVWGSGFTAGDSYTVQIWDGANPVNLTHTSSEAVTVNSEGAIGGSWSTSVSAGLYTVAVTDASGVVATAPLVVEEVVTVTLTAMNSSGQNGTATLTQRGDDTVKVSITLSAGAVQSELVHIHSGQCGATLAGVVHPLDNFVTDASGSQVSEITLTGLILSTLLTDGFAINAHQKGVPSIYTACGNMLTIITLAEQNSSGQTGVATLIGRGNDTEVRVQATAGISELNHIHLGQCGEATLGGVDKGLTNTNGGSVTTIVNATLGSLRDGNHAINLHQKGSPGVYTSCGNIPR